MTASMMPMEMLSAPYGYGLAQKDRLIDASGKAQRAVWLQTGPKWPPTWKGSASSMVMDCPQMAASLKPMEMLRQTDWPQMTASMMPMEMLSGLYGYGPAPNGRLEILDATGNAQRTLQLWTGPK